MKKCNCILNKLIVIRRYYILCAALIVLIQSLSKRSFTQTIILGGDHDLSLPVPLFDDKGQYYVDSSARLAPSKIASKTFHPFSHYFQTAQAHLPVNYIVWLKVSLQNNYPNDTTIAFYLGFQNAINLYRDSGGILLNIARAGNLVPPSSWNIPGISQAVTAVVKTRAKSTFYISVKNRVIYHVDEFKPFVISKAGLFELQAKQAEQTRTSDIMFFLFIGMFLMMFIYIFIKWLLQKDITYLYYSVNIVSGAVFFLVNYFEEGNNTIALPWNPIVNYIVSDFFLFISIFAYWQFTNHFLYLSRTMPKLSKLMHIVSYCIVGLALLSAVLIISTGNLMGVVMIDSAAGALVLAIAIYVCVCLKQVRSPLRNFVYGSIFCMMFSYTISSVFEALKDTQWEFFKGLSGSMPLIMSGHIGEMLFFTFGLAYRNKLDLQEQSNARVQIAEAEMKALRAQMNPHFIFNCMHTIDAYIFKNEAENASRFLNKFSKLIRQVLENAIHPLITLRKEIEMLRLFTELELERYDHCFDVFFAFNDGILNMGYKIPPMIIQPYVENAILHGLRQKKGSRGLLTISIREEDTTLLIVVTDNGIGRAAALLDKAVNGNKHTSMALALTQQRLSVMSNKGSVSISDNTCPDSGTSVQIVIPKMI